MAMFTTANPEIDATNQEKIKYLKRYVILDQEIDRLVSDLDRLRSRLGKLTSTLSDLPGGGGSIYKSVDIDIVDKIVDLEAKINRRIDEFVRIREDIEQLINSVGDDKQRLLLSYRYIDGQQFEWIASTMHYSWRHIHRLHSAALQNIKLS